jgi:Tol biopolymer transport system component
VFAPGDSSIWLQDASTLVAKPLLKHTEDEYYESPAFSPDGSHVVYVAYTFDQGGGQVKQIRTIDVDGKDERTLFQPAPGGSETYLGDPRFSPDGASIYFSVAITQDKLLGKSLYEIARGPAGGGQWQVVLQGGDHPSLSRDGKRISFLKFNPQRFSSSLWVADSDGSNPRQLLADDVFAGVIGQRFSPDGAWIVFSASGPPRTPLPGLSLERAPAYPEGSLPQQDICFYGIGPACFVQKVYADGLPWDIWLVSSDGRRFEQLTKLGLDSPWPAFSKDGRFIAFISTNGLFVYDREVKQASLLDKESAHGVMDWIQE